MSNVTHSIRQQTDYMFSPNKSKIFFAVVVVDGER